MSDYDPFQPAHMRGKPLTSMMDNVLATRIGRAVNKAAEASAGDLIDRGLAALHELNEAGFDLIKRPEPQSQKVGG